MVFFAISTGICYSQNPINQNSFWEKVNIGGGIGLGFSNRGFNGSIAPSAIYNVNNYFSAGISLNANYASFEDSRLFAYGGSLISFYNPISFLQISGELEQLRVNQTVNLEGGEFNNNYWSPSLYLGVGYRINNAVIGLRYNLLHNDTSIYADALLPFVRVYF